MIFRFTFLWAFLLAFNPSWAQYYAFGCYAQHFTQMPDMQRITDEFNLRESHTLKPFRTMMGYRFGFGSYGRWTMIELAYGNSNKVQKSNNPAQLKENAEVRVNFASVQFNMGFRPFARQYFVVGMGLNLGQRRARYSFGGDYTAPVVNYTIVPEFFIDYGLKIRFLAKRDQRDKIFYLLRLRPFYQLHGKLDLQKMQQQFNADETAAANEWEDNWSNFGFQVGIVVPFGRNVEELAKKQNKDKTNKNPKTPKESKGGRD